VLGTIQVAAKQMFEVSADVVFARCKFDRFFGFRRISRHARPISGAVESNSEITFVK